MRFKYIVFFLISVFLPSVAAADLGPKETLEKILGDMVAQKNIAAVLNYIHWSTAFKNLKPAQRQQLNVTTPEQLKAFYKRMLNDPAGYLRERMEGRMASVPPEQRAVVEGQLNQMLDGVNQKLAQENAKIGRTKYTIGEVDTKGKRSTIQLSAAVDGQVKNNEVVLVQQEDGKWYLPSLEQGPGSQKPMTPTPGGAPAPVAQKKAPAPVAQKKAPAPVAQKKAPAPAPAAAE